MLKGYRWRISILAAAAVGGGKWSWIPVAAFMTLGGDDVDDLMQRLGERVKALAGTWPSYATLGGVVLYLVGYLTLRFHLTALGAGFDTTVVDERYLFTGARFVVYLISLVPSVVLVALILGALLWLPARLLPKRAREGVAVWVAQPQRLALIGIAFSVFMIQFWMRDCFELSDLLLRDRLPYDNRLAVWLARNDGAGIALYFTWLVAGCLISGIVLLAVLRLPADSDGAGVLRPLFGFLVAVQFLLLPVNYGYLVVDKNLPRVASLDGSTALKKGTRAWLVWEGKEGVTFLVRRDDGARNLIFVKRDEVKRIDIVANDPIVHALYSSAGAKR
jgi:hypothetical protein